MYHVEKDGVVVKVDKLSEFCHVLGLLAGIPVEPEIQERIRRQEANWD